MKCLEDLSQLNKINRRQKTLCQAIRREGDCGKIETILCADRVAATELWVLTSVWGFSVVFPELFTFIRKTGFSYIQELMEANAIIHSQELG